MKFLKETEKAVLVNAYVENVMNEKRYDMQIWMPKSQLNGNIMSDWIFEAKYAEIADKLHTRVANIFIDFKDAEGADLRTAPKAESKAMKGLKKALKKHVA